MVSIPCVTDETRSPSGTSGFIFTPPRGSGVPPVVVLVAWLTEGLLAQLIPQLLGRFTLVGSASPQQVTFAAPPALQFFLFGTNELTDVEFAVEQSGILIPVD